MDNQIIEETEINYMDKALKTGLILGGIGLVTTLISGFTTNMGVQIIIGLANLVFLIYWLRKDILHHRNEDLGGFMSFNRGFMYSLLAGMVSIIIYSIFNYININFINPSMIDEKLNQAASIYEKLGMSEETIDEAISQARSSMTSIWGIFSTILFGGIFWALISLIFASVLGKKAPFFKA